MSITIRLARIGKKHDSFYRIVVIETRDRRNGKPLEYLGYYNPHDKTNSYKLDKKRYLYWKENGALETEAIRKIISGATDIVEKKLPKPKAAVV